MLRYFQLTAMEAVLILVESMVGGRRANRAGVSCVYSSDRAARPYRQGNIGSCILYPRLQLSHTHRAFQVSMRYQFLIANISYIPSLSWPRATSKKSSLKSAFLPYGLAALRIASSMASSAMPYLMPQLMLHQFFNI